MSVPAFAVPRAQEAAAPPEARGLARDDVRLLVASRSSGRLEHAPFRDLPALLAPGDLLVVNASATVAAAIDGRRADGTGVRVHVSAPAPDRPAGWWLVELRSAGGARPHYRWRSMDGTDVRRFHERRRRRWRGPERS
jgi:S-adenosylmethionine:tRNA ribosyltransferase-isomerase